MAVPRCRMPTALEVIRRGTERIVEVSDDEIAEAIRIIYSATHNGAEGAGAAPSAALIKEREPAPRAARVAVILTGQNIDRACDADRAGRRHAKRRVRQL